METTTTIRSLLTKERAIWGTQKLSLDQIITCLNVILGDIARWQRDASKDTQAHTTKKLKKELGNLITSTIRWCDDLGFDANECIELAFDVQKKFQK